MNKILIASCILLLAGCTDAERATFGAYGEAADITCYSGGAAVFTDRSTGKVGQIDGDGITFRSATTGKYVRAFADCIVMSD